MKGFGSCSYCPDGVVVVMVMEDLGGLRNAGDTFRLSFVSQSLGRLGPEGNPPPPSLCAESEPCIVAGKL